MNLKKVMSTCLIVSLTAVLLCACGSSSSKEQSTQETSSAVVKEESSAETSKEQESSKEEESSQEVAAETAEAEESVLYIEYLGCKIGIQYDIEAIVAQIGEPEDLLVTSSCAYQGDDYYYYYESIEFVGNTDEEGVNRITSITLSDDTVSTIQGVTIGMDIEEALTLMDMDYEVNNRVYTFTSAGTVLKIQIGADNCIKAIQYQMA